jgi:hypothetical protein
MKKEQILVNRKRRWRGERLGFLFSFCEPFRDSACFSKKESKRNNEGRKVNNGKKFKPTTKWVTFQMTLRKVGRWQNVKVRNERKEVLIQVNANIGC